MNEKHTEIKTIKLNQLKTDIEKYQVWGVMLEEKYKQFVENVKANGIRDLIHVDEDYTVLDGHHRYNAAKELNIEEVSVKVYYGLSEEDKLGIAYTNNSMKKDISREEKIKKAIELRKGGRSQRQIAEWLGVSQPTINNWLKDFPTDKLLSVEKIESSDGKQRPAKMPTADERTERRRRGSRLRDSGKTIEEIAQELGISVGTVYNDLKAIEKLEIDEDKQKRRKKNEQELAVTDYEVKTRAELYPDINEDEPIFSTNNRLIHTRKSMTALATDVVGNYSILSDGDSNIKKAYLVEALSLARSLIISVGGHCDNEEYEELSFVILDLMKKIKLEEDIFND